MKQIPLTKGKFALVDDEDFEWLNKYKWYYCLGYAKRATHKPKKGFLMHREILNTPPKLLTDHIDGNKLNNQRNNLRICTQAENLQNSPKRKTNKSGYKGVCWFKPQQTWKTEITHNRKQIFLGYFKTKEEAALAYNNAAIKLHNKFANLNIIPIIK